MNTRRTFFSTILAFFTGTAVVAKGSALSKKTSSLNMTDSLRVAAMENNGVVSSERISAILQDKNNRQKIQAQLDSLINVIKDFPTKENKIPLKAWLKGARQIALIEPFN